MFGLLCPDPTLELITDTLLHGRLLTAGCNRGPFQSPSKSRPIRAGSCTVHRPIVWGVSSPFVHIRCATTVRPRGSLTALQPFPGGSLLHQHLGVRGYSALIRTGWLEGLKVALESQPLKDDNQFHLHPALPCLHQASKRSTQRAVIHSRCWKLVAVNPGKSVAAPTSGKRAGYKRRTAHARTVLVPMVENL